MAADDKTYRYCREIMTSPFWFKTIIMEIMVNAKRGLASKQTRRERTPAMVIQSTAKRREVDRSVQRQPLSPQKCQRSGHLTALLLVSIPRSLFRANDRTHFGIPRRLYRTLYLDTILNREYQYLIYLPSNYWCARVFATPHCNHRSS